MKKTQETDTGYETGIKEQKEKVQEAPGIEQCFERLDVLLSKMETPECSLEESFRLYEEGVRLIGSARQQISKVEQQLQILDGAEERLTPEEEKDGF